MIPAEKLVGKIPEGYVLKIQTTPPSGIIKTSCLQAESLQAKSIFEEFNTNNWDTVFAVRITDVNRAIVNGMKKNPEKYPQKWNSEVKGSLFNNPYKGNGTF